MAEFIKHEMKVTGDVDNPSETLQDYWDPVTPFVLNEHIQGGVPDDVLSEWWLTSVAVIAPAVLQSFGSGFSSAFN